MLWRQIRYETPKSWNKYYTLLTYKIKTIMLELFIYKEVKICWSTLKKLIIFIFKFYSSLGAFGFSDGGWEGVLLLFALQIFGKVFTAFGIVIFMKI